MKKLVIFLVGPTAVGKTEISFALAKRIDAEIISSDSMQVYREMDIGTSKPTLSLRKGVPHHLIDILDPSHEYSAAEFRKEALAVIEEIHKRDKIPLVVGGTGLYIRALVDGLFPGANADWDIRERFLEEADIYGKEFLYKRLNEVDPDTAVKIHPNDIRRVIRALEVYEKKQIPISKLKASTHGIESLYFIKMFGLIRPRCELYSRIEKRVERMFEDGLVDEVKFLSGSPISQTARQALGYSEVIGYLNGEYSLDEAKMLLKRNTRRYAKRQLTWFRKDTRIEWIETDEEERNEEVVERILKRLGIIVK